MVGDEYKPQIRGTDHAIWRRIRLIPFTQVFKGAREDKDLKRKLQAELPGILNWAIVGYERWFEKGLETPEAIKEATNEYHDEQDVVAQWIDERCEVEIDGSTQAGVLYSDFKQWSAGQFVLSNVKFAEQLRARGFDRFKSNGRYRWTGIRLVETSQPELKVDG